MAGRQPAVPVHPQRRLHAQHGQRGGPSSTWPADRGMCCHVGGDIDFDAAGNLYLSTGDDTNPFDSAGYAPIDERTNRNPAYDAQRTRGQHQRPARQGPADQGERRTGRTRSRPATCSRRAPPNTRPEIYAMGFRNPFRMSVDKATGVVYLGDYGPDAGVDQRQPRPERAGRVQPDHQRRATTAGRTAPAPTPATETYNEWNFATGSDRREVQLRRRPDQQLVPQHRPDARCPPARPAWIRYAGDAGSPAGVRRRLRVADGRPGLPLQREPEPVDDEVPGRRSTGSSSPASSAAAGSSRSRSTPTAPAARSRPSRGPASR